MITIGVICSLLGCDNLLVVKGEIDSPHENQLEKCNLDLYLAKKDKLVESLKISATFEESFVVAPFGPQYYMVIRCDNYSYKTRAYKLDAPEFTIDLGKVKLKASDVGSARR